MLNNLMSKIAGLSLQGTLILVLGVAAGYYFLLHDDGTILKTNLAALESQRVEAENQKIAAEKAIKEVEEIRKDYAKLSDEFKDVIAQLPPELPSKDVLSTASAMAVQSGISIKSTTNVEEKPAGIVSELPLKIQAVGTFSEITMFLFYVGTVEKIMKVKDFTIKGDGKSQRLNFTGEIVAYRYVGEKKETKK